MSHLLVASSDFPGLAEQGTYLDKLIYRRLGTPVETVTPVPGATEQIVTNPLSGRWVSDVGDSLELTVHTSRHQLLGHVHGSLCMAGETVAISGVTDINAPSALLSQQSVSLTAALKTMTLSLSGSLHLTDGELRLFALASQATTAETRYLQTRVSAVNFKRRW